MPPRNPADDDGEIPQEIGDAEDVEIEAEGLGNDDDEGSDQDTGDERSEENERQAPEGDGRSRVLDGERRSQRESALAKSNRLAREARAEADRVSRENAEIRAEIQRMRQPAVETPEQEQAKLALMEPEQRVEYRFNKAMQRQEQQNAALQFQLRDSTDKSTFAALAVGNAFYRSVAKEVETKLAELRRQGQDVAREALAKYIIGERVLAKGPKAVERQRSEGERRIQQQRGRPNAARSDQTSDERRRLSARDRLADVVF